MQETSYFTFLKRTIIKSDIFKFLSRRKRIESDSLATKLNDNFTVMFWINSKKKKKVSGSRKIFILNI